MIKITEILNEFTFETARSGGKGGQNVNKVESKVSLVWNFNESKLLSVKQKAKIYLNAKSYLFAGGVRITSQQSRSQLDNKQNTIKKLEVLLLLWLKENKPRKVTKIPNSVKRKRLINKKINSAIKKNRGKPNMED